MTGAAGGIGRATAARFAAEGAGVVLADLDAVLLSQQATSLDGHSLPLDVTDAAQVRQAIESALGWRGRLDALVNVAGVLDRTSVAELSPERWDYVQHINLRGTFLCAQAAIAAMRVAGRGAIVNVASQAGERGGLVASAAYAASKGGVIALTKSLARFAAPFGIRVNVVNPGLIATRMTDEYPAEALQAMVATTPLGRLGRPEDVANAIAFLASDDASFITWAQLSVSGGSSM